MTTPPTTLHDRLRAELDRRLALTRTAGTLNWNAFAVRKKNDSAWISFLRLHNPADATRRYEGELEVLERHVTTTTGCCLNCCDSTMHRNSGFSTAPYPCADLKSLASRLGMNIDG